MRVVLCIAATFLIMNAGTFVAYGGAAALFQLEPPAGVSPLELMLSVLLVKVGMAVGFVLLYALAEPAWRGSWGAYAMTWWIMFAIVEAGLAIGPNYTALEAAAGMVAEAIYFPLSAAVTARLLRERHAERAHRTRAGAGS